ncbi:MAG TPA: beta-ketoacyl synthase N-terminal-like domain-containing protein [Archangium sp.]|nr:beta-ketoacyl synthase N-terminal-like domain-containing protein [Archangium sp.]
MATVPVGVPGMPLAERLLALLLQSMHELQANAKLSRLDFRSTHLFICLPGANAGRSVPGLSEAFAEQFLDQLCLEVGSVTVLQEGRTSMISAVAQAAQRLRAGRCQYALLVGADSYLDSQTLRWLDDAWRLKSERNVDGFIPGECAALLLLELPRHAAMRKAPHLGLVTSLGNGIESCTLGSERRSTGSGLARAVEAALQGWDERRPFWTICDLNGESYRSQEWGVILTRMAGRIEKQQALWHPADCIGDVGVAAPGLHIAMACRAFARRAAKADAALVWCSSDDERRAACRIERPG